MSPSETSQQAGLLEHPAEAFDYYRAQGVPRVVCEEKHMGSRAVLVVCRDEETARRRFGVVGEGIGTCYTRTGRGFFNDPALGVEFLTRIHRALGESGLWEALHTDWICLDAELMPWSAKAQDLLRQQYAAVGSAASGALRDAVRVLGEVNNAETEALRELTIARVQLVDQYIDAYRRYCWPVASIDDYKLAPFHILATEDGTCFERDHVWHMETIAHLCASGAPLLQATPYQVIDVTDAASLQDGIQWWEALTGRGGEGMVVKPYNFLENGKHGLVQPALKCRGREYLRIIYGPEYTLPGNLERLRARGLAAKRSLALREFALGAEGLERFVRREPLRRVHECVFGVLAFESEAVDPRL
jgi:polynucleotide kinase-phosphatase